MLRYSLQQAKSARLKNVSQSRLQTRTVHKTGRLWEQEYTSQLFREVWTKTDCDMYCIHVLCIQTLCILLSAYTSVSTQGAEVHILCMLYLEYGRLQESCNKYERCGCVREGTYHPEVGVGTSLVLAVSLPVRVSLPTSV